MSVGNFSRPDVETEITKPGVCSGSHALYFAYVDKIVSWFIPRHKSGKFERIVSKGDVYKCKNCDYTEVHYSE